MAQGYGFLDGPLRSLRYIEESPICLRLLVNFSHFEVSVAKPGPTPLVCRYAVPANASPISVDFSGSLIVSGAMTRRRQFPRFQVVSKLKRHKPSRNFHVVELEGIMGCWRSLLLLRSGKPLVVILCCIAEQASKELNLRSSPLLVLAR